MWGSKLEKKSCAQNYPHVPARSYHPWPSSSLNYVTISCTGHVPMLKFCILVYLVYGDPGRHEITVAGEGIADSDRDMGLSGPKEIGSDT